MKGSGLPWIVWRGYLRVLLFCYLWDVKWGTYRVLTKGFYYLVFASKLVEQYLIWFDKKRVRKMTQDDWQHASSCKYPWALGLSKGHHQLSVFLQNQFGKMELICKNLSIQIVFVVTLFSFWWTEPKMSALSTLMTTLLKWCWCWHISGVVDLPVVDDMRSVDVEARCCPLSLGVDTPHT